MDKIGDGLLAVISGIITLAIVAVIVSAKGQSANVVTAGGTALAQVIQAAVSPVS